MCLAYPMKVIKVEKKHALVSTEGIRRQVNIEFLKNVKAGEYLMVHAGFAIEKFDPKKAKESLSAFCEYKNALRKSFKR